MWTHHPEGQNRRLPGDDDPQPPIAEEAMGRADEQQTQRWQHSRERPGEEAHAVPEVLGEAERRHLPLVVPQGSFDHRRDGAEEVPDAGDGLQPRTPAIGSWRRPSASPQLSPLDSPRCNKDTRLKSQSEAQVLNTYHTE